MRQAARTQATWANHLVHSPLALGHANKICSCPMATKHKRMYIASADAASLRMLLLALQQAHHTLSCLGCALDTPCWPRNFRCTPRSCDCLPSAQMKLLDPLRLLEDGYLHQPLVHQRT